MSYSGKTPAEVYETWHWGSRHEMERDWDDPRKDARGKDVYPDNLIECGRLFELRFLVPGNPALQHLTLTLADANRSHLCFDSYHPNHRLYLCLAPNVEQHVAQTLFQANPYKALRLRDVARLTGGRHADNTYPALVVKPVGLLESFVYGTTKKTDGKSLYVHRAGEESGIRPVLAADSHGRLWAAGGNYTSPPPGVTD